MSCLLAALDTIDHLESFAEELGNLLTDVLRASGSTVRPGRKSRSWWTPECSK
jgi:hypothetical protein